MVDDMTDALCLFTAQDSQELIKGLQSRQREQATEEQKKHLSPNREPSIWRLVKNAVFCTFEQASSALRSL